LFVEPVICSETTLEVINPSQIRGGRFNAPCEPVFNFMPTEDASDRDVLALSPPTTEILHREGVLRLNADASPSEELRLWQPTDKDDQLLRRFPLDFGQRVLVAQRSRANAG
jgi:hypothetical protein